MNAYNMYIVHVHFKFVSYLDYKLLVWQTASIVAILIRSLFIFKQNPKKRKILWEFKYSDRMLIIVFFVKSRTLGLQEIQLK